MKLSKILQLARPRPERSASFRSPSRAGVSTDAPTWIPRRTGKFVKNNYEEDISIEITIHGMKKASPFLLFSREPYKVMDVCESEPFIIIIVIFSAHVHGVNFFYLQTV